MYDMKQLVRLIAAIKASEGCDVLNMALFDAKVLGMTEKERDMHIIRLVRAGYVNGINTLCVHGECYPRVVWGDCAPMMTIDGLLFIAKNETFKKALKQLRK